MFVGAEQPRRFVLPRQHVFDAVAPDGAHAPALQLVAETFAVALFRMMAESARDPVLGELCRRILADEARHMGFGMLALPRVVREASEAERHAEYAPDYWATFFNDPDGLRLEVTNYRQERRERHDQWEEGRS